MSIQRDAYQLEETYINDTRVKHKTLLSSDLRWVSSEETYMRDLALQILPQDLRRPTEETYMRDLATCIRDLSTYM